MEALVRIARQKFIKSGQEKKIYVALERLMQEHVLPNARGQKASTFRDEHLYCEAVRTASKGCKRK